MSAQLARLNRPLVLLVAVIALGVLGDAVIVVNHFRTSNQVATQNEADDQGGAGEKHKQKDKAKQKAHPCNHGFYVSQAAHAHKGGAYVKEIAKSDLGKNGDCSAPLPAPGTTAPKPTSSESDQ